MATLTVTGVPGPIADAITARLDPPPLDTVVAGVDGLPTGAFLDVEQGDWEATVAGARSAFLFAQAEAARLVAAGQPGRIVFLVPTSSVRVVQGASLLSTAGAFLTTTAQVGAVELGPTGVTVNVVACGWAEGAADDLAAGVPVGRLARPDDVAAAVAFLASEDAAYVNGATLAVDGGYWITKTGGGSPLLS